MPPATYDPNSESEKPVPLPSAQKVSLSQHIDIQPPLSRRGTGPGIILFLPSNTTVEPSANQIDPDPALKWAEEGFAVAAVRANDDSLEDTLRTCLDALQNLDEVDVKDKASIIVYESKLINTVSEAASKDDRVVSLVGYGSFASPALQAPILLHLGANAPRPRHPPSQSTTVYTYNTTSPSFVLPHSPKYDAAAAATAHTRTLGFLRKTLGGPTFDLEAIWDEHCYFEFTERSVAKTMATMVAQPYVNHVPTMTGGFGREKLTEFYRDHFIFSNPDDVRLQPVSRTVGQDRIVDEFICNITHDRTVDWLLPGVPVTGRKLEIPMIAVVSVRGDRIFNEHIWWDQATVLKQAGILPSHLPLSETSVRLPVAGAEGAQMLVDGSKGKSNEMLEPQWAEHK